MKSAICISSLVLAASSASAGIISEIDVQGLVSKIYADKIVVYDAGELTEIPKKLIDHPTNLRVGQPVSVKMSFQDSLKLQHPTIPRGKLLHPRLK